MGHCQNNYSNMDKIERYRLVSLFEMESLSPRQIRRSIFRGLSLLPEDRVLCLCLILELNPCASDQFTLFIEVLELCHDEYDSVCQKGSL